ncbi:SGNH/GDSL hydrolase family protein, partial [Acinetobacter soli]|uniref:SGNH/GDSL hydrolase family protein n=1 Tax=Acinetobacter soli TaxID=487316 RepID=UPI00148EF977
SGTFDVSLFSPVVADKINYPFDIPYSKTKDSPWLGKNLMYFGDSNSRGNIAIEAMKQIGCNVYWNAAGGRSMQYRGVAEGDSDKGWLYHWTRRRHIKNLYDANKMLDLFLFNASYNDTSGGGTLSDAAVQAVLDNYPTLQDDSATVDAKLAIFNALTVQQRKDIFGYKQTFAAYLLQIIQMFPQAKIFLTTMLYSPASVDGTGTVSGSVNQQRAYDKAKRDAINADIRAIAAWYGVSVIDTNSNSGYYYGNMTTHTSDTIHFDEVVGKRIAHFTMKNILMQTV